jgi:hypothetical protein
MNCTTTHGSTNIKPNKFCLKWKFQLVWAVMMESMSDRYVLEVRRACTTITSIISLLCYKALLMPGIDPLPLILVFMASNRTVGFFIKSSIYQFRNNYFNMPNDKKQQLSDVKHSLVIFGDKDYPCLFTYEAISQRTAY